MEIIEKKNPLKQGLKLLRPEMLDAIEEDWKEESIKTRIETAKIDLKWDNCDDWKEESIKTRIETL